MKKTTIFLAGTLIVGNIFFIPLHVKANNQEVDTTLLEKEAEGISTSTDDLIDKITESNTSSENTEVSSTIDSTIATQESSVPTSETNTELSQESQSAMESSEYTSTEDTAEKETESSSIDKQALEVDNQEETLSEDIKTTSYSSEWLKQNFNVTYSADKKVYRLDSIKATNLKSIIIPSKVTENGQWIKLESTPDFWNSVKNYSNKANVTDFSILKYDNYEIGSWDQSTYNFSSLFNTDYKSLLSVDLEGLNWSYVSNCYGMFYNCDSLKKVNVSAGDDFKNVKSIAFMFSGCHNLETITNFDQANLANVESMRYMFQQCFSLVNISGNVINWKNFGSRPGGILGNAFDGVFTGCNSLEKIDISSLNTQGVTSARFMFNDCRSIKEIKLPYGDNAFRDINDISSIFSNCVELEEVKLDFGGAKITNISKMFYECTKLRKVEAYGFGLNATITQADQVFYTSTPRELIVINQNTNDYFMKYSGYATDNRIAMTTPKLDANGGIFTDTNQSEKSYFTKIPYVVSEVSRSKFNQWFQQETEKIERAGYTLVEWKQSVSDLDPNLSADNLALKNVSFVAEWKLYDYQTSSDNSLNPKTGELGIAYQPKSFSIGEYQLPSTGDKRIEISKSDGFNIGVKDLAGKSDEWTLTAQLVWKGGKEVPGAYLETKNSSGIVKRNLSNGSYVSTDDLEELSQGEIVGNKNVKINTTSSEIIMSGVAGKKRDGVYDYDLCGVDFYIPDVSIVPGGTYTGTVNWNLTLASP